MGSRTVFRSVLTAAAADAVLTGSAARVAPAAGAAGPPSYPCAPEVSGHPGDNSFTLHVGTSPTCTYKVRAWATCIDDVKKYGPYVSAGHTSKASCGLDGPIKLYDYGWQGAGYTGRMG